MTSGGARVRSGPAPDPNALRRDRDQKDWLELPAGGRDGDPPAWPLSRPTQRELELWAGEWRRPQAVAWEARGHDMQVALYVRALKDAEKPKATVASRQLVARLFDSLGLSEAGLRANKWVIVSEAQARDVDRRAVRDHPTNTKEQLLKLVVDRGA